MSIPVRLQIPRRVLEDMLDHARTDFPNECCGLLAGKTFPSDLAECAGGEMAWLAERGYRLINAAASPVEFESQPESLFKAHRDMRRLGLEVLAVYHSHPSSAPIPSRTDLARNYSEEVMNFIVSLTSGEPEVRAWWLTAKGYAEARWECVE